MMTALYFGCARGIDGDTEHGHFFWEVDDRGRLRWPKRHSNWEVRNPWGMPDGKLAPRSSRYGECPQGVAALHHKDGWTALAFWDRSGDSRGNSNSNFLFDEDLTFDQALAKARESFPALFARFQFEVVSLEGPGDGAAR